MLQLLVLKINSTANFFSYQLSASIVETPASWTDTVHFPNNFADYCWINNTWTDEIPSRYR